MNHPLVSVIFPVHNSEKYVYEALNSIVKQTYSNLEILVIVNGTTDSSYEEIAKIQDERIKLIDIKEKIGLITSLNIGIDEAKGDYLARMDSDDIAMPERIEKQIEFLESNPEYGLCGSWYQLFDGRDELGRNETENDQIKIRFLHQCHMCHPTVVLRTSVVKNHQLKYSNEFPHCEDYGLWVDMSDKTKFKILPEILLKYRDHDFNISKLESTTQDERSIAAKLFFLEKLGVKSNSQQVLAFEKFAQADFGISSEELNWVDQLIVGLLNSKQKIIDHQALKTYLHNKWNAMVLNNSSVGITEIHKKSYIGSSLNSSKINSLIKIKRGIKKMIRK